MKEVILIIKLFQKNSKVQSLNEFLNIKDIKRNYLYTLYNHIVVFINVNPINIELLSDSELERKMDSEAIEFSNEQYPYKIMVIPRAVDISEHIREQEQLKKTLEDDVESLSTEIESILDLISTKGMQLDQYDFQYCRYT